MKNSKDNEHRISNLKDMIDNVKTENTEETEKVDDLEEDAELINYLHEESDDFDDLEIDDEYIYHPDEDDENAINLEENPINEDYIINTPKEVDENTGEFLDDMNDEISESFDNFINSKIGGTSVLGILSTILGIIFIGISIVIFQSRSDRVIDNVISGENPFMVVIFLVLGLLFIIFGILKITGWTPLSSISKNIDSLGEDDEKEDEDEESDKTEETKALPKSNIPLDKDSYKIGEFKMGDLKNKLKKHDEEEPMKKPTPKVKEKNNEEESKAEIQPEQTDDLTDEIDEYEVIEHEGESIDDIFADVEEMDDIPFTVDKNKEK